MCMAIPSRVTHLSGMTATVECFGQRREVSLALMADEVRLGDYLLVQAGGFAYERVEEQAARAALALFEDVLRGGETPWNGHVAPG